MDHETAQSQSGQSAYIQKATAGGGFASLTQAEADELDRPSKLVAEYEEGLDLTPAAEA